MQAAFLGKRYRLRKSGRCVLAVVILMNPLVGPSRSRYVKKWNCVKEGHCKLHVSADLTTGTTVFWNGAETMWTVLCLLWAMWRFKKLRFSILSSSITAGFDRKEKKILFFFLYTFSYRNRFQRRPQCHSFVFRVFSLVRKSIILYFMKKIQASHLYTYIYFFLSNKRHILYL